METADIDLAELKRFGFFVVAFFVLTPLTLLATVLSLVTVANATPTQPELTNQVRILSALSAKETSVLSATAIAADARVEIVRQYLTRYDSPLTSHAEDLVAAADKYQLDFRLLTAIAQQESNVCKKIPENSFNCWGWGIHKRGTLGFESFEEAIEVVSAGIKTEYINKGYVTPEEIMKKYTPSSPGTWAAGVSAFMAAME